MNIHPQVRATTAQTTEHFDVLIVGAGISGVGAAYHLTQQCPGTTFVALETQDSFGGTWLTHRYPGIRSDSDLHTFGYRFKPWTSAPIATAEEILAYMGDVIEENGLDPHIRYRHTILSASWSSAESLWTIDAVRTDTGQRLALHGEFLLGVPGLLPPLGGLHAGVEGLCGLPRPHRASAALARRPRLPRERPSS